MSRLMKRMLCSGGRRRLRAVKRLSNETSTRHPLGEQLEPRLLMTNVINVSPQAGTHTAEVSTQVEVTFDQAINPTTATTAGLVVHASQQGQLTDSSIAVDSAGTTVSLDPAFDFLPGERVQVTATSRIQSTTGDPVIPTAWEFRAGVSASSGLFANSGQSLGNHATRAVSLGDLDGDGDLDAFVANQLQGNRIWMNDAGRFTDSVQELGSYRSGDVALGDVDADGDLDAMVANGFYEPNRLWLNDGSGAFIDSGQRLGAGVSYRVSLGDLDSDGDLDAFVANRGQGNRVWRNDGDGLFIDSGQTLGNHDSIGLALGDIDGDGDLDAFVGNYRFGEANRVWMNSGDGQFTDSGQLLGNHTSWDVELGDLDGDGDLDAFTTNAEHQNRIWMNDGDGLFTDSGQALGSDRHMSSELGDLDGDGDLDAYVANGAAPDRVWSNNGSGVFSDSGQRLQRYGNRFALGDLDSDGDLDTYIGNPSGGEPNRVWLNQQLEPSVVLTVDTTTILEGAESAVVTAELSAAHSLPVSIDLGLSGSATQSVDYTISNTQITIPAGSTTGSITVTAVQDDVDEDDETVVVNILSVTHALEAAEQEITVTIVDDDLPSFAVTALTPTASGFMVEFSDELNIGPLNLYDAQSVGASVPDVVLQGASNGLVQGSLVIDQSLRKVTFIKSGAPLSPDEYTVTLRSASDGFVDQGGRLLDGNGDGEEGGDYTQSFNITEPSGDTITVGLPDFTRGPGQDVNLPADETVGIPLSISDGTEVRAIDLQISYDPTLLEITGATVASGMPPGASVIANTTTPGRLILVFFSATALPLGSSDFVHLQARVPATNPDGIYGKQQVLDVHSATIGDGNDNEFPVIADGAVHLVSYLADVSGNRRINASDAAQVARVAALLDGGFAATPLTDPGMIGDISGNGRINAADASLVARFAALIPVPEIPPLPSTTEAGGAFRFATPESNQAGGDEVANSVANAPSEASLDATWENTAFQRRATNLAVTDEWRTDGLKSDDSPTLEDAIDEFFAALDELTQESL